MQAVAIPPPASGKPEPAGSTIGFIRQPVSSGTAPVGKDRHMFHKDERLVLLIDGANRRTIADVLDRKFRNRRPELLG